MWTMHFCPIALWSLLAALEPSMGESAPNELSYETPVGSHRTLTLGDGIRVDLNTDTHVRVKVTGGSQVVTLDRGEVFIRTRHEARARLTVKVDQLVISDSEASFDVYRRNDGRISISVIEGRVHLESQCPSTSDPPMPRVPGEVAMGERITVGREVVTENLNLKITSPEPAWIDGYMIFSGESLTDIVDEFNRYNLERLVIVDPSIAPLRIGGGWRTTEVEQFIANLQGLFGIRSTRSIEAGVVVIHLSRFGS
jgi:transmembrane sensor